jgi:hypothetical protein
MKITELFVKRSTAPILKEGIIHPEDLIWTDGIPGAQRAIAGLAAMATGQELTTIKWDGFPALIFGRNLDGTLMVTDKHMFDKKDGSGRVTSPQAFRQYDVNRGADRSKDPNAGNLYTKIDILWPALEAIIPADFRGFYFGDLLYAGRLQPTDGAYVFKPNTVTYKVPLKLGAQANPIAQKISSSIAGIAVHTFIPGIGEGDQPLNGLGGLPDNGNPVWFVTGEMPVPKVQVDKTALNAVNAEVKKNSGAVTDFLGQLTVLKAKGVIGLASKYITSKITAGNFDHMLEGFYDYLNSNLSPGANEKLLGGGQGWLYNEGRAGLEGMFAIWVALYNFKLNIKQQIDSQQASGGIQAFTGNDPGHEGYVVGGGADKFKLIDRLGFSRANFKKNG